MHALLNVAVMAAHSGGDTLIRMLPKLDKIKVELAVSGGATLTVERTIPNISNTIVDLG